MLELLIILISTGLVYLIAWGLARLVGRFLPERCRTGLPWLLFNAYLVVGLFVTGDLPGAPRAVVKLAALAAVLGLVIGLGMRYLRRQPPAVVSTWVLAGMLPWVAALLAEALA